MVSGIGVDIVQIPRIAQQYAKWGKMFIQRILSIAEQQQFTGLSTERAINYLAKRFAAKEAVAKALGTGIGRPYRFTDIEILNTASGQPYVQINSKYIIKQKILVSLADDPPTAIAFVMISGSN